MGLRFRKSIKVAPGVKLNLNRNSTSVTIGTKGAHYTVNSNGKKTTSASIPGTGLSYVSTTSGKKRKLKQTKNASKTTPTTKPTPSKGSSTKKSNKNSKEPAKAQPKKKGGCLGSVLLVFAILCLIFAIVPSSDKKEDSKEANQQKMVEEQSEEITISQSGDVTDPNIDKITENLPEDNIDSEPIATAQPENADNMVWLPESGTKYHSNSSCSNMNNPRQVTLDEAVNAGYEPCKKCY